MQPQGATPWRKRGGQQPSPFLGSSSASLWHNEEEGPEHAAAVRSTSSRRAKGPRGRGGRGTQPQPSQEQPPTTNTTTGGSPPQRQQRHNSQSPKRTSPQTTTVREQASLFGSGKRRWGRGKGSGGNGGGSGGSGGGNGGKVMKQNSFVAEIKCYKEDLLEYDETEGQKAEAEGKRRGRRGGRDSTNRNNKKAGTEPTARAKLAQRRRVSTPLLATPHVTPEQALQEFSPLHMAARRGNLDMLNALLARGENPSSKSFGCTPLHWAAFEGHARCVERLLLVKDIEVDELEPEERTPLALAARKGHLECVELLIAAGADVNRKNKWEETPLIKAASYNHVECLRILLQNKADVDAQDMWLETALFKAASKGHTECVRLLLQEQANVQLRNEMGCAALHAAVMGGWKECVHLLLMFGADPEATDNYNRTVLSLIEENKENEEILQALKKASLDRCKFRLEAKGITNWSPEDVRDWVEAIGYPQYAKNFARHHISGPLLLKKLDMEVLKKELGIASYGARDEIMQRIEAMHGSRDSSRKKIQDYLRKHYIGDTIARIDFSELQLYENLGKGHFGEVKRAVWNGTEVAVKVIYRNSYKGDSALFEKEVIMLSHVRHPNVIMILAVSCTPEGNHCIVMEYMSGGSLHALIQDCFFALENQPSLRHRIALDICKGMAYLHANKPKPILHRDLSSYNILLDNNKTTKVADFGLSHVKQESENEAYAVGQIPWMAPEVLRNETYTEYADVYSFGCVLYELWTGKEPHCGNFGGADENGATIVDHYAFQQHQQQMDPKLFGEMVKGGFRPTIPATVPDRWRLLISSCMHSVPQQRPSFKEILEELDQLSEGTAGRWPLASLTSAMGGWSLSDAAAGRGQEQGTIGGEEAIGITTWASAEVDEYEPCYLSDS